MKTDKSVQREDRVHKLFTRTTIRLSQLYKQLETVEKADAARRPRIELLAMLQEIDEASVGIFVPRTNLPEYIDFRQFLHDMRDRIASGNERELKSEDRKPEIVWPELVNQRLDMTEVNKTWLDDYKKKYNLE